MNGRVRQWIFLGKVWLLLAALRAGLWVLPFATVRRLVSRWGRQAARLERRGSRQPHTLARAVQRAARWVPGASCLTQALATQVLLARAGHAHQLGLGLRRGSAGELQAHAWVRSGEQVVIGAGELDLFVPLAMLEQKRE